MTQTTAPTTDERWLTGTWIQTYSGSRFSLTDFNPLDVHLEDLAHHLSMLCRFTGAVRSFYSVAQHSVLVARILDLALYDRRVQFLGLMHDTTEAYVADLNRPAKGLCGDYKELENRVWTRAIAPRFNMPLLLPPAVKWADNVALFMERRDLMNGPKSEWSDEEHAADMFDWPVVPLAPEDAERDFLDCFYRLWVR